MMSIVLILITELTRHPFLGEKSTGSSPRQSNTTSVLNLLLSSTLYLVRVSGRMSIEFSLPHS